MIDRREAFVRGGLAALAALFGGGRRKVYSDTWRCKCGKELVYHPAGEWRDAASGVELHFLPSSKARCGLFEDGKFRYLDSGRALRTVS